jgi:hypothetical protein
MSEISNPPVGARETQYQLRPTALEMPFSSGNSSARQPYGCDSHAPLSGRAVGARAVRVKQACELIGIGRSKLY